MKGRFRHGLLLIVLVALFLSTLAAPHFTAAEPMGAVIVSNRTETPSPAAAAASTTAGGSFTTLVLNVTMQTPRWKAYVGNVTGSFALRNALNATLYSWGAFVAPAGEVYASRAVNIDWGTITCADSAAISAEDTLLNHSATQVDSINHTFNRTVHTSFYVGTTLIPASTCPAISLYVNGTSQEAAGENADFQEILLKDSANDLIYTSLINNDQYGYNNETLDFEMIVPEDEFASTPHTYYFWLEIS